SGLVRLSGGRLTRWTRKDGMPSDIVYSLAIDRAGGVWAGTYGGGVARLSGGRVEVIDRSRGLPRDVIRSIHHTRDGVTWIGTDGGGLARLQDDSLSVLDSRHGLANDTVFSFHEDAEGLLWIGTAGGLLVLRRGGSLRAGGLAAGPPQGGVFAIPVGGVWLTALILADQRFRCLAAEEGMPAEPGTASKGLGC
ncbi:MAG TPA: two-component regulator propeller domain-containing protein, partial [Thermoanaerobaculia bacterium]|nr:two-component regulator propeller domain-containing protein [Thermoanaerobaculia bacterium]